MTLLGFAEKAAHLHVILNSLKHYSISLKDLIDYTFASQDEVFLQTQFKADLPFLLSRLSKFTNEPSDWAENYITSEIQAEISKLTDVRSGYHLNACKVSPSQILQFSIEGMAADMELKAPRLWRLLDHALNADHRKRLDAEKLRARRAQAVSAEEELMDADDVSDPMEVDGQRPPAHTISNKLYKQLIRAEDLTMVVSDSYSACISSNYSY